MLPQETIIGFWVGRKYGHAAVDRYRQSVLVKSERLESVWRFVNRYGAIAVFGARFIPGLRFMAGPLAGAAGLRPIGTAIGVVLVLLWRALRAIRTRT